METRKRSGSGALRWAWLLLWSLAALTTGCDDDASAVGGDEDRGLRADGAAPGTDATTQRPDARATDGRLPDAATRDAEIIADLGLPDAEPDQGPDAEVADADVDAGRPDAAVDAAVDAALPDAGPDGCGGDIDCPLGQVCDAEGRCVARCDLGGCGDGFFCNFQGLCAEGDCAGDGVCAPGAFCSEDGQCHAGCRRDPDDCGLGLVCGADRQCVPVAGCVDEGTPCETGAPGACGPGTVLCDDAQQPACVPVVSPAAERCDGADDDCDGQTDEDFGGVGEPCVGGQGACRFDGALACTASGDGTMCVAAGAPTEPGAETCNGADDDCDGRADEGLGLGAGCLAGEGLCAAQGLTICGSDGGVVCGAVPGAPSDERCDQTDNDCDGSIDEGLSLGEACGAGRGACRRDGSFVCGANGAVACSASAAPPGEETCNGIDDDCDGRLDEGVAQDDVCFTEGLGVCRSGRRLCVAGGRQCVADAEASAEVCNGLDDDCDGTADEDTGSVACGQGVCRRDVSACENGVPGNGACDPLLGAAAETCDGLDNDCDGTVDEAVPGVGAACGAGEGACRQVGVRVCAAGRLSCNAVAGAPSAETCNDQDDDCDGLVDEGTVDPEADCFVGRGGCRVAGAPACVDGSVVCEGEPGLPQDEACNGIDDDCDGQADEGFGAAVPCGVGQCRQLLVACDGGEPRACDPLEGAEPERCDGIDNDCDGAVDEAAAGAGVACNVGQGQCRAAGLTICQAGALRCDGVPGQPGAETCNTLDDDCDGRTDEQASDAGGNCVAGVGLCARGGVQVCAGGQIACNAVAAAPQAETCDLQDNDCDGRLDESLGTVRCGAGLCQREIPACQGGVVPQCDPLQGAQPERCNATDDDCDGTVDEEAQGAGTDCAIGQGACFAIGPRACQNGELVCTAQALPPGPERCDGIDNDCDGGADEGLDLGLFCEIGAGDCRATGSVVCSAEGDAVCNGQPGQPAAETCDGGDNDCDGRTDEGLNDGAACVALQPGVCSAGRRGCANGVSSCVSAVQPSQDTCNGLDDDCDGQNDEGLGTVNCGLGICARPVAACVNGAAGACDPRQGARAELCNNLDDDCDGRVDEDAGDVGNGCSAGVGACVRNGQTQCVGGQVTCGAQAAAPQAELCNGIDDDCDGRSDEAVVLADCNAGVGVCQRTAPRQCVGGAVVCTAVAGAPGAEVCNALDDDCDGRLDEGFGNSVECGLGACRHAVAACAGGEVPACDPMQGAGVERCNGIDDDCDGTTDENTPEVGAACGAGEGQCRREGTTVCTDGAVVCGVTPGAPAAELCNGLDEDCDGRTDEQASGAGVACQAGDGLCAANGTLICDLGRLRCNAVPGQPRAEACNALDDDCDGASDERLGSFECGLGICRRTLEACVAGAPVACDPQAGARAETCNGQDDDCDGGLDEGLGTVNCGQGVCARQVPACLGGQPGACNPLEGSGAEVCNNRDDDCDGRVDEGVADQVCTVGQGNCNAVGALRCTAGVMRCDAVSGQPQAEVCNRADDDCDGRTDENPTDVGVQCEAGLGACRDVQVTRCDNGVLSCPAVARPPQAETCNQADDDCDGPVDEDGPDCNANGVGDQCDLFFGRAPDCNQNGVPDLCDVNSGRSEDCNLNGVPDECFNDGQACIPDNEAPEVTLFLQGTVINRGTTIQIVVQTPQGDPSGIAERGLLVGGQVVALDGFGQAFVTFNTPGNVAVLGFAIDGAGNRGEASNSVRVLDPADVTAPIITLHRPQNGAQAPAILEFEWSVEDANLSEWILTWGPNGDPQANELARGYAAFVRQVVATLDTSGLAAGQWFFRMRATDINGRGRSITGFFTIAQCTPQAEACDGRDNDCDGRVDEAFGQLGQACTGGVGDCAADGIWRCGGNGEITCDADEGIEQIESCDGRDNDCDGRIDERWAVGQVCSAGAGLCTRAGQIVCTANGNNAVCDAVAGAPAAEACDGDDNDCDARIDEGIFGCGIDTPPTLSLVVSADVLPGPGPLTVTLNAADNVGVEVLELNLDGVPVDLAGGNQVQVNLARPGIYAFDAVAIDGAGQRAEASRTVRVEDPLDRDSPQVDIFEPRPGAIVEQSIPILGVASDANLIAWHLSIGPAADPSQIPLASGVTSIDGVLAQLDLDLLPGDGNWRLLLFARDVNLRQTVIVRDIVVRRCVPVAELCDGADNDCDDAIDEDLVACAGDEVPPQVTLNVGAEVVNPGTAVPVQVTGVDDVAMDRVTLSLNGAPIALDAQGFAAVTLNDPGRAVFVGTAYDRAGNHAEDTFTVRVLAPNDADFPEIQLHSPAPGAVLDGITGVMATVTDAYLWQWSLYQGTVANPQETLRATGISNVVNAALGTVDAAALAPGEYRLQIVAEDVNGRTRTITSPFLVQPCEPAPERCDFVDNDCDGRLDEAFAELGQPCNNGVGQCRQAGVFACRADGAGTTCTAQPGAPIAETCDGSDNDCDARVDEGFGLGVACASGVGACARAGQTQCSANGAGAVCSAVPGAPVVEVCDQADNDCDGEVDEGFERVECGLGACFRVIGQCPGDPNLPQCEPFAGAAPERCNGIDDDCDGVTDEQATDVGGVCGTGVGACSAEGVEVCQAGAKVCSAQAGAPVAEQCNQLDDDCDGSVDESQVCPDEVPPVVTINLQINAVNPGAAFWVQVLASDDRGVGLIQVILDGVTHGVDANGIANLVAPAQPGAYDVVARVTDVAGNVTEESARLFVLDAGDVTPPTAQITAPAADALLTADTVVLGTATDPNLVRWTVSYAQQNVNQWIVLFEGDSEVVAAPLGTLKPGQMENGMYRLRLDAEDVNGRIGRDEVVIRVDGQAKIGHFRMEFVDANITVAGAPLTVKRVYDSRVPFKRDFGVGWTLDVRAGKVEHNRPTSEDWEVTSGGGFLNLPCQRSSETEPHITEIRLSDRERYAFRPVVDPGAALQGACEVYLRYEFVGSSVPGRARLQIIGNNFGYYLNGNPDLVDDQFEPLEINQVRLTTPDGRVFDMALDGAFRLGDGKGNDVFIGDNGLQHSGGKSVQFVRDAQGRIVRLDEPGGDSVRYGYDARGDLVTVTDQAGHITRFEYDNAHHLLRVIDPLGRVPSRQIYDEDGRMIAVEDAEGNRQEFDRDLDARQESVTDRLGHIEVFSYDARGNVTRHVNKRGAVNTSTHDAQDRKLTETDPAGNTTFFTYDGEGRLVLTRDALGNERTRTYDANNRVLSETDFAGAVTRYTYDAQGNVLTRTDPVGNVSSYVYDAKGNKTRQTDPGGGVWQWTYDASGQPLTETNPLGEVVSYLYDAKGHRVRETRSFSDPQQGGPVPHVLSMSFDGNGNMVEVVDALGGVRRIDYNALGKPVRDVDAEGRVTTFEYDGTGNLARTVFPNGSEEIQTWDAEGRRVALTDREGQTTEYTYDAMGDVVRIDFADGTFVTRTYDSRGLMIQERDATGALTTREFDALGRNTATIDALGRRTEYEFDAASRQTAVVHPDGQREAFTLDANGKVLTRTLPGGAVERFTYDGRGNKTRFEDVAGNFTDYAYDALDRLVSVTDSLGGVTRYTYDEVGNRVGVEDANGNLTVTDFDKMGHPIAETLPEGEVKHMVYDRTGRMVAFEDFDGTLTQYTLDAMGELVQRNTAGEPVETAQRSPGGKRTRYTDARGQETWAYDPVGRLTSHTNADGVLLRWTYNANGMVDSRIDPTGTTTMSYDAIGRLASVTGPDNGVTTYTYNLAGSLATLTLPNGVVTTYTYSPRQYLLGLRTVNALGAVLADYRYTVGPMGERLLAEELHRNRTVAYTYDALSRLIQERTTEGDGSVRTVQYTYDAVGNRLSMTDSVAGQVVYTYDDNDRVTQAGPVAFEYDPRGNLNRRTGPGLLQDYVYDARNRMVMVETNGDLVSYGYDMESNRVSETRGAQTLKFVFDTSGDLSQLLQVRTAAGVPVASYVQGADLIAQQRDGETHYYGHDGQFSVRHLSDAAGVKVMSYDYDAFGNETFRMGDVENPFTYAGEYVDGTTGFVYLRARWLDPETGRFMARDPAAGRPFEPPSFHRYTYAENDPIGRSDPSGQFSMVSISISISIQGSLRSIYTSNLLKTFLKVNQIAQCVLRGAYADMNLGMEFLLSGVDGGDEMYSSGRQKVAAAYRAIGQAIGETWQNILDDMVKFEFKIDHAIDLKVAKIKSGCKGKFGAGSGYSGECKWLEIEPFWQEYKDKAVKTYTTAKKWYEALTGSFAGDACAQAELMQLVGNKLISKMPSF